MRILHVINCIEIGGAEIFLLRLMKELEKQGHVNFLMTLSSENNNDALLDQFLNNSKTKVLRKNKPKNKFVTQLLYKVNGLFKRITGKEFYDKLEAKLQDVYLKKLKRAHAIELINSHLLSSDFFAADILKPAMRIPLVITSQGCYNDYENSKAVAHLIDQIDGMTYVAEKNLDIFASTGNPLPDNRKLIYNGMERPSLSPKIKRTKIGLDDKDFVVGQISRSIKEKGMEVAIKSTIYLKEEKSLHTIKLVIIGPENDYYNSLKEHYKKYTYIHFPGAALNPTDWISLFDVGILPSYFASESCPSTIVEYLSLGKPAIASQIGEIPAMISSAYGAGGKIIPHLDENSIPDYIAFAEQIKWYYSHPDSLKQDSLFALDAFTKFEISNTTKEYLEVYTTAKLNHG